MMEEDIANRPKWLLELENRKRKPRLAHEAGAGAPCMNCNSNCPGLDLHFWRKICKNCKCGRDDHDVDDDEFPQFDLLFGPSAKFKKKSMRLQVNNKKQNEGETTFEWVPPDTTKELVMDYMKALPEDKLPIKGSAGAALRRQLLQKQLPLHDIDHKACDALSEQEQRQFEKYLENIKKYAGQGKVIKILGARPFDRSLMTPVNATDMQRCSPQHKPYVSSPGVQLRTPSSFAVRSPYAKHPSDSPSKQDIAATNDSRALEEYNRSLANVSTVSGNVVRSQPIEGKLHENPQHVGDAASTNERAAVNGKIVNSSIPVRLAEQEIQPVHEMHTSGSFVPSAGSRARNASSANPDERHRETLSDIGAPYGFAHSEAQDSEAVSIAESMLADALLPPSAIHANDIIGSTLGEEGLMYIREKLADKYNALENPVLYTAPKSSRPLDTSDLLQPRGGTAPREANNSQSSVTKDAERAAAMRNSAGSFAERREITTGALLEAEKKTCKPLSHVAQSTVAPAGLNEQKQYGWLLTHKLPDVRPSAPLAQDVFGAIENAADPSVNRYKPADTVVPASNPSPQVGSQYSVIPSPLLQAELSSSHVQPTVLHSEQLHNPVFPHNVVGGGVNEVAQRNAMEEHLKNAMEGLRIDSTRAQKCRKCHEDIRVGDVVVTAEKAKDASWHPGCFVCSVCNELLVDLVYFHYKNELYCERDLSAHLGIPRCFACDELIFVREYTVAEGHNYHVKHFCCWDCDMPLAGQQYITENDRPLCLPCYQKTYAKTCAACNIVIAADQQGVSIKNLDFHATEACFCCYSCKKNLLNGRMAIKENKLFCSKECIAKFLNR
ncbi:PREDICTED: PDZ and LIM domain protein Zasp [Dinoponera quadriceps]|uniref:PDZ and LIM domain protein Zasp n=1 Tax=Dinoponera quadriceps TaxID=609295 RepID=A0A6P3WTM5_DINQU|nr:PREDICTED: PDZ and LIM domain protein Zasp [Dinoponera quadriceps]